jgi:hypothetical protein
MTRSEFLKTQYAYGSLQDQGTFDRWLKANAVIGSIFAVALVGMALGGSNAGPAQAVAGSAHATEVSAAARQDDQGRTLSSYELTVRIAPNQLPVLQVDEPF